MVDPILREMRLAHVAERDDDGIVDGVLTDQSLHAALAVGLAALGQFGVPGLEQRAGVGRAA